MDSTVLIPLMFSVEPEFDDLRDGALIRVTRPDGEHVGVLQVTHLPDPPRIGAVVRFGPSTATGDSVPPPASDRGFVATGHAGLPVHRLTLEELREIKRTGDAQVPFALTVLQP